MLMTCTIQVVRLSSSSTQKKTFAWKFIPQQLIITLIPLPAIFTFSAVAAEEGKIY